MANSAQPYGQGSITSLKGADQVRKKASVIFGTNDKMGAFHGVYEIIANSIDEAREGYGNQIRVSIKKDGEVEVSDDGRGIPMEWNEAEGKYNWELVFCTLYASGKYDSSNYAGSLGTNGLGATAMQYASEYMDVYSTRDGYTCYMHFEKGNPVGQLKKMKAIREGSGTTIRFKPDKEVFTGISDDAVMEPEFYLNVLRRQAMLHAGLEIILSYEGIDHPISLLYKKGISEFIDTVTTKPMLRSTVYFEDTTVTNNNEPSDHEDFKFNERLALNFSRETQFIEMYHNGSHLFEGGTTFEALKSGLLSAFTQIARETGKIKSSEKFLFKDIESILVAIGDSNAPGHKSFFKNQTKSALLNLAFGVEYSKFVYESIRNWYKHNKTEVEKIVSEIAVNKTAREEAEKVSKKVVNSLSKAVTGFGNKPKKFVDCRSKFAPERELWIVEGDSAAGSCKLARDAAFQAIMPVRGKIINCLKEDLSRVLSSEIIIDLLRIMGCGIEAKSKYIKDLPAFDIDKLNFGKIIICTDADIDGMQIRCLILTMLYRLCPTLIKKNRVYIAETPLFEIIYKGKTYFAYNEPEKTKIMEELHNQGAKDSQIKVNRSKGLGENDPDMMNESTMNPLSRRLVPVEFVEDEEFIAQTFNALLGEDITSRKEIIQEYFKMTDVDIE